MIINYEAYSVQFDRGHGRMVELPLNVAETVLLDELPPLSEMTVEDVRG